MRGDGTKVTTTSSAVPNGTTSGLTVNTLDSSTAAETRRAFEEIYVNKQCERVIQNQYLRTFFQEGRTRVCVGGGRGGGATNRKPDVENDDFHEFRLSYKFKSLN